MLKTYKKHNLTIMLIYNMINYLQNMSKFAIIFKILLTQMSQHKQIKKIYIFIGKKFKNNLSSLFKN